MFARKTFVALWVAAAAASIVAPPATAGPWLPNPGESYASLSGSWSSSETYYDVDGTRTTLPGGGVDERRTARGMVELGWKPWASFTLDVPFVSATRITDDDLTDYTETGFGDMVVGLNWRKASKRQGATAWSLETTAKVPLGYWQDWLMPASTIAHLDSTVLLDASPADSANYVRFGGPPVLGDGQFDLQGLLHFGTAIGQIGFVQLRGGYRHRMGYPADQALAGGDLGLWVAPKLLLSGRYDGAFAVGDGDDTDADRIGRQRAGGELLYRIDGRMDVFAGTLHTFGIENALKRDEYYVGIAVRQTSLERLQGFLGGTRRP